MTLSARQLPSWRFARGILLSLSRHISLSYPVSFPPSLPSSPAAHLWPFICPLSLSPPLFWLVCFFRAWCTPLLFLLLSVSPPAVCPPGAGMVVQQFLVVWCKSPRCWYCDVYMDLTLVRLVQLFCPACPLSRLAWVGPAASVVGRGVRCQGCKAWHQRLRPCVGISLYTMWSALVPTPTDSAEMVLHFMHLDPTPLDPGPDCRWILLSHFCLLIF